MSKRLSQFVVVCVISLLLLSVVAGVVTGVRAFLAAQRAIEESASRGALHYLGAAMKRYDYESQTLPPARVRRGDCLHSWRVILEEVEQGGTDPPFAYDYSLSWGSDFNRRVAANGAHLPFSYEMESPSFTRFVAVVAPGTAFPGTYPLPLSEIRDPLADTALLIEFPESDILWTEPRDLTWNEAIALLAGNPRTDGWRRAILFADYRVYRINRPLHPSAAKAILTVAGAEDTTRKDLLHDGVLVPGG